MGRNLGKRSGRIKASLGERSIHSSADISAATRHLLHSEPLIQYGQPAQVSRSGVWLCGPSEIHRAPTRREKRLPAGWQSLPLQIRSLQQKWKQPSLHGIWGPGVPELGELVISSPLLSPRESTCNHLVHYGTPCMIGWFYSNGTYHSYTTYHWGTEMERQEMKFLNAPCRSPWHPRAMSAMVWPETWWVACSTSWAVVDGSCWKRAVTQRQCQRDGWRGTKLESSSATAVAMTLRLAL